MGFFKQIAKEAAKAQKAKQAKAKEQLSSANWAPPTVSAPVPTSGEPYEVKLAGGKQITFSLNTKDISAEAVSQLSGKYVEDEEDIEKTVRVVIFRDLESPYPDSVRVVTTKGHLVGWVLKSDSAVACTVLDQLATGVHAEVEASRGRPIHANVSAYIEGMWDVYDDEGETVYEADIRDVEIRIKNPVQVTSE